MRHEAENGKQLIIGVWLKKGKPGVQNTDSANYLSRIFEKTPTWWEKDSAVDQTERATESDLNPYIGMHLKDREFFSYMGSLTAPPCTADVQWLMAAQADVIAKRDLEKFRQFLASKEAASDGFHHNYRSVQPLNGRTIVSGFFKAAGEPESETEAAVSEQMTKLRQSKSHSMSAQLGSGRKSQKKAEQATMSTSIMAGIVAAVCGFLLIIAAVFRRQKVASQNAAELEQMGLTPDEYGRPDLVTTAHL